MKREADTEDSGESWLPELSFSTVLTVVGIGVTVIDLFFRFYRSKTEKVSYDFNFGIYISRNLHFSKKSCAPPRIGMVLKKTIQTIGKKCLKQK